MEDINSKADSFIVDGNKFVYVGTIEGAMKFLSDQEYKVVDLEKKFVLPGFNDSHMHFVHYGETLSRVNLVGTKSISEIRERVKKGIYSRGKDDKSWLIGEGWNQDYFTDEKRFPNKSDLDDITGDVPTLIMRACFHIGVLNSAALDKIGLNKESAKKYGNLIELLPNGEPNGVIKEGFLDDLKAKISTLNLKSLKDVLLDAQDKALAQGLTTVQTDDLGYVSNYDYDMFFKALSDLDKEGKLHIRIGEQCLLQKPETINKFFEKGYKYGFGNNMYRVNCIKLLSDGSLGARTAALRCPYADDNTTKGIAAFTQKELNELVLVSHRNNCPVAIHAIGDRAIEMSLNAIENAQKQDPTHNPRHGIVHCQITDDELLDRFKELDVLAFVQPIFIDYDMNVVNDRVGGDLANSSYAWKTMIDKGIHVSFGTDCPVESFRTMPNIYSAVTRKNISGEEKKVYLSGETVSMYDAIKAYTVEGAYASGEENIKGSISEGKLADFITIDKDLFNLGNNVEILETRVLETYVDGKKVY